MGDCMPMSGRTKCAVRGCAGKIQGSGNLCRDHYAPGLCVREESGDCTMITTVWYAEHGTEYGTILLSDFTLGDFFDGELGFRAYLAAQGFENVRLIARPQDFELSTDPLKHINQTLGEWAGPWQPVYPWQEEIPRLYDIRSVN